LRFRAHRTWSLSFEDRVYDDDGQDGRASLDVIAMASVVGDRDNHVMDMSGTYDLRLVALSFLVAVATSYTALDLASRVTSASGWVRAR